MFAWIAVIRGLETKQRMLSALIAMLSWKLTNRVNGITVINRISLLLPNVKVFR